MKVSRINSIWLLVVCNLLASIAIILQFVASLPAINVYAIAGASLAVGSAIVAVWQGIKSDKEQKQEIVGQIKKDNEQKKTLALHNQNFQLFISLIVIGFAVIGEYVKQKREVAP